MAEADPQIVANTATAESPAPARRWGRIALMLAVPIGAAIFAWTYWTSLQGKVATDNAYVKQDMVAIGAEVGGRIIDVRVQEDDVVKPGELLFRIDPEPYQLQMAEATAAIANAQADVTALENNADLTGVDIAAAREDIAFARSRLQRQQQLWDRGFTTKADYDAATHAVAQAEEGLRQAQARQAEAAAKLAHGAAVPGVNPQVAAAQAHRESASLGLRRTEVRAPLGGRVAQADRLQRGQQILPNLPVLTLVSEDSTYVEANFKETDLAEMQVGQRAEVRVDAYPGTVLKGHVAAIGAGTGSQFSVLPAQNASGNWVKVTQRVPVRIALDEKGGHRLIAGLSTEVTVFTGKTRN